MTSASPPPWAGPLIEILDRQCRLYKQLQGLGAEQKQLVQSGDPERLLGLMSQRQRLIDELTQVSGELEPYRAKWDEHWAALDGESRARVGDLVRQVQDRLEQIMKQDEEDRATLAARRTQTAGDLQRMRQGASVNRAYAPKVGAPVSRYADRQG
jgi:flagellar biosynthesis/type III secretory pathway chaperone